MKRCYLDANMFLYYSNPDSLSHKQAVTMISQLLSDKWELNLSPLTLDEYFHNMIRFSRVSRQEALKDLKKSFARICKLPGLCLISPGLGWKSQQKVIRFMSKHNLRARDAYHLFIMLENKIKFLATFDNNFKNVFEGGIIKKFED